MKTLLHWWRLWTEPSGYGRLHAMQPKRWYVQYHDGTKTIPMAYDVAFGYADMFGGEVKRYKERG